jgi:HEAT repeat protein
VGKKCQRSFPAYIRGNCTLTPFKLVSLLRYGLLLALVTGSTSLSAQDGRADADGVDAGAAIYQRLNSSGIYERRKALDELLSVAPDDPGTVEVLIRQFQSQDAEEARFSDFIQRVERALQSSASKTTWPAGNVELLTSVLVHNDAYDARATNRTASTVAGVARYQAFSHQAIDDLTTVLWHRVDKNPNRTRNDNTRSYVARALRQIYMRQGLPRAVIDISVASLGSEPNSGVRRETVLLIDACARAQPASEAMVQALIETLFNDDKAAVRTLAARALRGIGEQRDDPRSIINVLQQAAAGDPDQAVRREALTGLMAAAALHARSPEALPPEAMAQLLQAAAGDPDARVRLRVLQALGKVYATRAPDPATLELLLERLREESDSEVRGLIAVTLQEIHARQGLDPAVIEPLIPLVTDDPVEAVRQAISRMLAEPPAGQDLVAWMEATHQMGLSPAGAATSVAVPDRPPQNHQAEQPELRARLLAQYVSALSGGRAPAVRKEILQGLFALSLTEPLPQPAVEVLERSLESDTDAGLRLQVAAVLLHNGLQHRRDSGSFYPALADGDARVHTYAAFAVVELSAVDGDVLPGLLDYARDPSVHRNLRAYSLRRLALWRAAVRDLPAPVQADLLELTGEPDVELRAEVWNALSQFKPGEQVWRRAAADEDLGIRRMAWRELEAQGVAKPVWAKWRDPKQRLQLVAVGLLGATLLAVVAGAVLFFWRLLLWLLGTRQQRGKLIAAQLLWLVAALLTLVLDGGIVFMVGLAHVGLSEKDLMQLNTVFGVILASYAAVACLGWKLLPARKT